MARAEEQLEILRRGTVSIVSEDEILTRIRGSIKTRKPLRVKLGVDASAPDIHIGHAVPLRKLRQFQTLGHEVDFVIGDFTGRIGDPSGRSETRKQLTDEEVAANAQTYKEQVFRILDPDKTHVHFNSEWLGKLSFVDVIKLGATTTVARMLERDDFSNRYKEERPISLHEFFYPLAQAYDSCHLHSDIELGGTDQTFNFLMTRDIMREYGVAPQIVLTLPILEGTDGVNKMSKSLGNYIGINEPPSQIFGKTMSISDSLITKYFELATDVGMAEILQTQKQMDEGTLNPRDAKMQLAYEIVAIYYSKTEAQHAKDEFIRVFSQRELPEDIKTWTPQQNDTENGKINIVRLLAGAGLAVSASEARRLVSQGAVRVDDTRIEDTNVMIDIIEGTIIRVGRRRFLKLG